MSAEDARAADDEITASLAILPPIEPIAGGRLVGERLSDVPAPPLEALLAPSGAERTLHWGRNYLWVTSWPGLGPVVVKQFRHEAWRARLSRRRKGSKARRSFTVARALVGHGIPTPGPLLWAEGPALRDPAWYVCRFVDGIEARYPFRALAAGTLAESFPALDAESLLGACAALARQLHAHAIWHRDLSAGNLLLARDEGEPWRASVVDLNRARLLDRLTLSQRLRDLARLPAQREADQRRLLALYLERAPTPREWRLYHGYHRAFHGRHRLKNALRGKGSTATRARRGPLDLLRPRRAYPHLPPPPADASLRDRTVWDALSDQPHQHAGRGGKLLVRLRDAPGHLGSLLVAAAAAPRIARRYCALVGGLFAQPVAMGDAGVALRPYPEDPEALLALVDELGVRHALLRVHPWDERHEGRVEEILLARALHHRGIDVVVALPQRRELVRDLARWERNVEELGQRLAPFASAFQIGQAINRSKWGVWTLAEYRALLQRAARALRATERPLVGPGVIDFEPHATVAAVNAPRLGVRLGALASLLYVDRRGAPEATQLGFDALRKAALLRAIAETARWCAPRSWITEVNWPLREGPHAPAGRDVAVDEQAAADYLARYYLPILASGMAERVYWWQLVARGYGLVVPEGRRLRRRPAFLALATLQRLLAGATCTAAVRAPEGAHLLRFATADDGELLAGWSAAGEREIELPWRPAAIVRQDGEEGRALTGLRARLGSSVQYFVR